MLSKDALKSVAAILDDLDFYKILKVPSHASDEEIRAAFHREALALHPDQYQPLKDNEAHELSKKIYARVVEAYRVLSSASKRKDYDVSLKKRLSKGTAAEEDPFDDNEITAVRRKEKTTTTTAGLRFFKMAQAAFQSKDLGAAKMNIQIALNTDPHNPEFLDLESRITAEIIRKKK